MPTPRSLLAVACLFGVLGPAPTAFAKNLNLGVGILPGQGGGPHYGQQQQQQQKSNEKSGSQKVKQRQEQQAPQPPQKKKSPYQRMQ
jgi:hypothetical protein